MWLTCPQWCARAERSQEQASVEAVLEGVECTLHHQIILTLG